MLFGLLIHSWIFNAIQGSLKVEKTEANYGQITSPTFSDCKMAPTRAWELPFRESTYLVLMVVELRIERCENVKLLLTSGSENITFCDAIVPDHVVFSSAVSVQFHMDTNHCSDIFRIDFYYLEPMVQVASPTPATVDETVTFQVVLNNHLNNTSVFRHDDRLLPRCYLNFGDNSTSNQFSEKFVTIEKIYALPKTYTVQLQCELNGKNIHSKHQLAVEGNLNKIRWSVHFIANEIDFMTNVTLQFTHIYSYPIYYHLTIGEVSLSRRLLEMSFSRFKTKSLQPVSFYLDATMQRHLGAGKHDFTLVLENNVSSVAHHHSFFLNEPISDLKVIAARYVGLHPRSFNVRVTISRGAPVHVTVRIFRRSNNKTAAIVTSHCLRQCSLLLINATLLNSGSDYVIEALAENHLSRAMAHYSSLVATPLVYDVFIASNEPLVINSQNKIWFCILGDVGDFSVRVRVSGRLVVQKHINVKSLGRFSDTMINFPGNPTDYRVFTERLFFPSGGNVSVSFEISNSLKTSFFDQNVFVFVDKACWVTARIFDGRLQRWQQKPLEVSKTLRLVGGSWCRCERPSVVKFRWHIHEVGPFHGKPKPENKVDLGEEFIEQELVVDTDRLRPGYFVIIFSVSSFNHGGSEVTGHDQDYTLVRVLSYIPDPVVEGGSTRQIGRSQKAILFKTTTEYKDSFSWFCATNRSSLPSDCNIGKVTRKDSCFGWNSSLWFSDQNQPTIMTSQFATFSTFYIKVFISRVGIDPKTNEQQIDVKDEELPTLYLRCVSNCGQKLVFQIPLIIEAKCDLCTNLSWKLMGHNADLLDWCRNSHFCKISQNIMKKKLGQERTYLLVTGKNLLGKETKATQFLDPARTPQRQKCIVFPSTKTAVLIPFHVKCFAPDEVHSPLFYKFFLFDSARSYPLLQYGYDATLTNVTIGVQAVETKVFLVEICTLENSCFTKNISVLVTPQQNFKPNYIRDLKTAITSRNLQAIVQLLVYNSNYITIAPLIDDIIKALISMKQTSVEMTKQLCDAINIVTSMTLDKNNQVQVKQLLTNARTYMVAAATEHDIPFLALSCISAISNLVRSCDLRQFLEGPISPFSSMRDFMKSNILPNENTQVYESAGEIGFFHRFKNKKDAMETRSLPIVFPDLTFDDSKDGIDVEVHVYNSLNFNDDLRRQNFDGVMSVVFNGKLSENTVTSIGDAVGTFFAYFSLHERNLNRHHFVKQRLFNSSEKTHAGGAVVIDLGMEEDRSGSVLEMHIVDHNRVASSINVVIVDVGGRGFNLTKNFNTSNHSYVWSLSCGLFPTAIREYRVGFQAELNPRKLQNTAINFSLTVTISKCLFWNDIIQMWSDFECKAQVDLSHKLLKCACRGFTPLLREHRMDGSIRPTLIAVKMRTPPSFDRTVRNPVGYIFIFTVYLSSFLLIYFLLFISLNKKDNTVKEKGYVIFPSCTLRNNIKHRYLLTFYTGCLPYSGSRASVAFKLKGDNGDSDVCVVKGTCKKRVFASCGVDSFVLSSSQSLGGVTELQVWNEEDKPSNWYLGRAAVRDERTGQCYFFQCSSRVVENKRYSFRSNNASKRLNLLRVKMEICLRDRHLVWSMLCTRPWIAETLSRVARLAICFSNLSIVMLSSSAYYKYKLDWFATISEQNVEQILFNGLVIASVGFPFSVMLRFLLRSKVWVKISTQPSLPPPSDEIKKRPIERGSPESNRDLSTSFDDLSFSPDETTATTISNKSAVIESRTGSEINNSKEDFINPNPLEASVSFYNRTLNDRRNEDAIEEEHQKEQENTSYDSSDRASDTNAYESSDRASDTNAYESSSITDTSGAYQSVLSSPSNFDNVTIVRLCTSQSDEFVQHNVVLPASSTDFLDSVTNDRFDEETITKDLLESAHDRADFALSNSAPNKVNGSEIRNQSKSTSQLPPLHATMETPYHKPSGAGGEKMEIPFKTLEEKRNELINKESVVKENSHIVDNTSCDSEPAQTGEEVEAKQKPLFLIKSHSENFCETNKNIIVPNIKNKNTLKYFLRSPQLIEFLHSKDKPPTDRDSSSSARSTFRSDQSSTNSSRKSSQTNRNQIIEQSQLEEKSDRTEKNDVKINELFSCFDRPAIKKEVFLNLDCSESTEQTGLRLPSSVTKEEVSLNLNLPTKFRNTSPVTFESGQEMPQTSFQPEVKEHMSFTSCHLSSKGKTSLKSASSIGEKKAFSSSSHFESDNKTSHNSCSSARKEQTSPSLYPPASKRFRLQDKSNRADESNRFNGSEGGQCNSLTESISCFEKPSLKSVTNSIKLAEQQHLEIFTEQNNKNVSIPQKFPEKNTQNNLQANTTRLSFSDQNNLILNERTKKYFNRKRKKLVCVAQTREVNNNDRGLKSRIGPANVAPYNIGYCPFYQEKVSNKPKNAETTIITTRLPAETKASNSSSERFVDPTSFRRSLKTNKGNYSEKQFLINKKTFNSQNLITTSKVKTKKVGHNAFEEEQISSQYHPKVGHNASKEEQILSHYHPKVGHNASKEEQMSSHYNPNSDTGGLAPNNCSQVLIALPHKPAETSGSSKDMHLNCLLLEDPLSGLTCSSTDPVPKSKLKTVLHANKLNNKNNKFLKINKKPSKTLESNSTTSASNYYLKHLHWTNNEEILGLSLPPEKKCQKVISEKNKKRHIGSLMSSSCSTKMNTNNSEKMIKQENRNTTTLLQVKQTDSKSIKRLVNSFNDQSIEFNSNFGCECFNYGQKQSKNFPKKLCTLQPVDAECMCHCRAENPNPETCLKETSRQILVTKSKFEDNSNSPMSTSKAAENTNDRLPTTSNTIIKQWINNSPFLPISGNLETTSSLEAMHPARSRSSFHTVESAFTSDSSLSTSAFQSSDLETVIMYPSARVFSNETEDTLCTANHNFRYRSVSQTLCFKIILRSMVALIVVGSLVSSFYVGMDLSFDQSIKWLYTVSIAHLFSLLGFESIYTLGCFFFYVICGLEHDELDWFPPINVERK